MPNQLDANGLQLRTQQELIDFFTAKYQGAYGSSISLSPDSPDGQMMMIYIQDALDMQDLMMQIYNSFNPDLAIGAVLDQRIGINGIQRQAGTFTTSFVNITVSQALTLYGLDQALQSVFTISDNAGNQWQLQSSIVISTPGTYTLLFQSSKAGAVYTIPNTITTPVSIILGVTSINNPSSYSVLGINEESDYDVRVRRQKSVALSSQGYYEGLLAALQNIPGITSAFVYENNTAITDSNGVPANSIWVIVSGSAPAASIANAIYQKRNAGAGMRGAQSLAIPQQNGQQFIVRWDVVTAQDLFIKFTVTPLDGVTAVNIAAIRAGLVSTFVPGVAAQVNANDLADKVRAIDPNALVTNASFSTTYNGTYTPSLTPTAKNYQFSITSPNIIITPMQNTPATATVARLATKQFTGLGGYGSYTWSIPTNASGGSVSASGLYTAGSVVGTDVVRVTGSLGNYADATVTVV